jgi:enoyl-CoA hydratase/carnithine racemase
MSGVRAQRHRVDTGEIAEITLDRPEAMNALSTAVLEHLARAFGEVAADGRVRVVVLSAAGERAFCVGADLKERAAMNDAEILAQRPVLRPSARCSRSRSR